MLYTALVPLEEVDSVLRAVGGIGHGVQSDPRHPAFRMSGSYSPPFSIDGPDRSKRFESLVHTWLNHNKTVLLPDSALLMSYGLIPRISKDGRIFWDDPDRLVYDVVRVTPLSTYSTGVSTTARVTVRRDYLEDYLSLKGCAAVATYWDERYSSDDPEVAALMGDRGAKFEQPGRELWFLPAKRFGNQVSQVWGCTLLLAPSGQPISDPPESELTWPDRVTPIKGSGGHISFEHFETAYVRDEVLAEYEKRDEFEIMPEAGFVSYDGRWSVSYCSRFGRNHIELELRKLYEGAPFDVIKHFNKFAVKAAIAEKDRETFGTRHIGIRARDLVQAFLQLTVTLSHLSDAAGLSFTQAEIGHFDSADITYKGWWTFPDLRSLGYVAPLTMARSDFLSRCTEVFKLLENLQPASLRQIVIELGVKKEAIAEFKGLKLLAAICQSTTISNEGGFNLVSDRAQVSASWDAARIVPELQPLFALNALRTVESHKFSTSTPAKMSDALGVFGIDENQCRAGWGTALDLIYDRTASTLEQVNKLVQEACARIPFLGWA